LKTFAFIFARGGSKGLPRKNIRKLAGKPLIAHSIDAAKEISSIKKIFVSTEDPEIASIAEQNQAVVIHRPSSLAFLSHPTTHQNGYLGNTQLITLRIILVLSKISLACRLHPLLEILMILLAVLVLIKEGSIL